MLNDDCLEISPVMPDNNSDVMSEYHSSLSIEGRLWIPRALRELVSLREQSVMMRIEGGAIRIYLRKVFRTLGFGP
jgi:bifunctional DNA-binding transcriptional regulator/antitoxin component of YhaV-PrlF toxin-antitoxin module